MKVLVVRHGETDYNRQRKMQGYQEIPLNDLGIRQAAQLARHVETAGIGHIVCSDLRRAVMTGCIVAARTSAPMSYHRGLRERDPGELVEQSYDAEPRFFSDPSYSPPGGEGVAEFRDRVRSTFEDIGREFEGHCSTLMIVAHGLVCHAFVDCFFGAKFSEGVGASNASMTTARYEKGQWALVEATSSVHLDISTRSRGLTETLTGPGA